MTLKKIGENSFFDEDTKTTYSFLFNHELSVEEAERRAYAFLRQRTEYLLQKHVYGREHAIPEVGDISGHPGFGF